MSYRVLWTVRTPFSRADGSFYCLSLFCACKALQIKDFSAPNCPHKTSFSVHFLFSAACELWRHSRGSISPGLTLGRTLCRRPHSVLAPYPGKSLLPAFRFAARPTSGTTYSRPRKKWSGGRCGCPHRQGAYSSRPHNSSTSGGSGRLPVSSVLVSCGKGSRPACALWAAVVYMGSLSFVPSILLFCAVLPEKASCLVVASCVSFVSPQAAKLTRSAAPPLPTKPCDFAGTPTMAACSGVGTLPGLRDILSRSGSLRCFPCRGIPFRTVIHFSRCSSSMNYPKSTPKRPPAPYIHKVGNQPGKLSISTLLELW